MRLTLIGHMTVWIEIDGRVLLTDPWFGPHGWLERRLTPRTVPPVALPAGGQPDVLLVSHNHLDHVDDIALDLARRIGCTVVGSQKAARRACKAGVEQVIALRPGEQTALGSLAIRAVCAEHPLANDAIGFVVSGSQTCYFSGDTRFTPALADDLKPFVLDAALIQAACAHYPILGDDGMSLPEAATLARAVRPRWTVPLHLHCAGKWLDRAAGLRIERDDAEQVDAAVQRWAASLEAEGIGVAVLAPGQTWDIGMGT
jgi:L-ascorbate metabolism protein UlaG (beta-lactamase superfamily)